MSCCLCCCTAVRQKLVALTPEQHRLQVKAGSTDRKDLEYYVKWKDKVSSAEHRVFKTMRALGFGVCLHALKHRI